jgi:RNA polymerase sigma-70 factor (ECF subfamily)
VCGPVGFETVGPQKGSAAPRNPFPSPRALPVEVPPWRGSPPAAKSPFVQARPEPYAAMTPLSPSDAELLARISAGDRAAFEELVARHEKAMFRFARRVVGEDAEDVLQEAFLSVWRSAAGWRGEASARSWLFQIVAHGCHRRLRRSAGERATAGPEDALGVPAPAAAPDAVVSSRQLGRALEAALRALEPEAREVLILRDVEGLPGEEVAQVLGIGLAAMKSRLHRARLALKERIEAVLGRPIGEELS